jgi:putative FmdB family regulatory protein
MPLYEYECQACGHRFEVIQKFSDAPPAECPKCGSGFYLTDYGRGGKSDRGPGKTAKADGGDKAAKSDKAETPAKSEGASSSGSGDSAAKTTESKPSTPAAPKAD